jgi:hypothetical protein
MVAPLIVFEPTILPYKFAADKYPFVCIPIGETKVFDPIDKRFRGFVFAIPTFPRVTRELPAFVNWTVFDVVFPLLTTCSRVEAKELVVMELILPFASTVMFGTEVVDPYVPGATLVVQAKL